MAQSMDAADLRRDVAELLYLSPDELAEDQDLFAMGLDSVRLLALVERWREHGVDVSLIDLAERPTLAAWSRLITGTRREAGREPDRGGDARWPLTEAQLGIWTGQQLDPASPAYNTAEYAEIRGPVEAPVFEAAVRRVVGETEALSAGLTADDEGRPWLVPGEAPAWPFHVLDLSGEGDPMAAARAWMNEDVATPIDLTADSLFGHALLKLAPDRYVWYHRVHHIALDGFGLALVARRVAAVYTALAGREPPGEADFGSLRAVVEEDTAYQSSSRRELDRAHWLERCSGAPEPVTLAGRPAKQSATFLRTVFDIAPATAESMRTLAHAASVAWSDVFLAACAAYTHRLTGAREVALGLPVMGRLASASLRVPGMVLNIVPLRVPVDPQAGLRELAAAVASRIREDRPHHRYRYEHLRQDLGLSGERGRLYGPAVNIMPFDYGLDFAGNRATVHNVSAGPVEDVSINVYDRADGTGLRIAMDGNPACLDEAELAAHGSRLLAFLGSALAEPERPLRDLDLLLADERHRLLVEWNDTARDVPPETVTELFERQAALTPEAIALVCGEVALSYREVNTRANRLARLLVEYGAGPEQYVALLLPRSAELVIAVLAVLKAGAAYLPLDPGLPARRLRYMLDDARPALLLAPRDMASDVAEPDAVRTVLLDDPAVRAALDGRASRRPCSARPELDLTDEDRRAPLRPAGPAYLIYTSGSTGRPKGVVVQHDGLSSLYHHHRREIYLRETAAAGADRVRAALTAPLSFDTSWEGLFWMVAGHELHLIEDEVRRDPEAMVRYAADHAIGFLDVTPSYAEELIAAGLLTPGRRAPKVVALGGEAVGRALWDRLRSTPGTVGYNLYGPTECTIDTLWCRLEESTTPIVGRPVANTRAHVLDASLRLLPPGAAGELYLSGIALARGYHGRPELTADRFVADPYGPPGSRMYRTGDLARRRFDGTLEYLGRADEQVQIRGFRVEPGEIEAVLLEHPGVSQAAVVVREDTPGLARLVAYTASTDDLDPAALRAHAADRLPSYMVPAAFVNLPKLPLNANGKLDRKALPKPDHALDTPRRRPRTPLEQRLCELFAETLGLAEIGIDDDFFDMGGHSLLVTRLAGRIRRELGVDLRAGAVFDRPTACRLAELLADGRTEAEPPVPADLEAEAVLDPAIRAGGTTPGGPLAAGGVQRVLLTGATGFLGAFLLHELLERTTAEVWCLVRAATPGEARERIHRALRRYRLTDAPAAPNRIIAVPGDLERPRLGLDEPAFERMAEQIDVIVHNGATVNHLAPYSRLKAANVAGTQEILRLAASTRTKPVHHLSTCDVAADANGGPRTLPEDRLAPAPAVLPNGYVASKWVAERLVRAARDRGLPTSIYRPSRVGGHSRTGAGGTEDALWNLIRAMIVLGAVPAEFMADTAFTVDLVPADYVAGAVVHLALRAPGGRSYHLTHPRPASIAAVVGRLRDLGYDLPPVSRREWDRRLAESAERGALAGDYSLARASLTSANFGGAPSRRHFVRANVRNGLAGSDITCPPIDGMLLGRYVDFFVESGFLPPAAKGLGEAHAPSDGRTTGDTGASEGQSPA
ncbi:non-ribosomal peptide synthetase [Actinomadura formosensis]|uniref:non-ribosomal peptide synthetase n=1 Tax=Actinomadura formosensis TaxID=60706 RepID=UPI000A65F41D|nr:non-ribosomal peptide synthetase [Actinomadura formosensis]